MIKNKMSSINVIVHKGKTIAHHYYNKDSGWLIVWSKGLKEEKEVYKKEIQEMADKNEIKVDFEDEK